MSAQSGSLLSGCDVLLVTATDRETDALRVALEEVTTAGTKAVYGGRQTYTDHGVIAGARVLRVRSEMGAGTPGGTASTVADAIQEVAPRAIIMVGIAFGTKGKANQSLGTVLVSKQLQDYELQRFGTGADGSLRMTARGDRVSASTRLVNLLRHARETWKKKPVEFGLVLSGDKLVDNIDYLAILKAQFPEAIGGEMEGRGLYVEAKERAEWIVVKAICDWADGNKREGKAHKQEDAAEAAASFVLHAIRQGGLAPREARRAGGSQGLGGGRSRSQSDGPKRGANPMRDLSNFLTRYFDESGLRRLAEYCVSPDFAAELLGQGTPRRDLADSLAKELDRHGLIQYEFFRCLEGERDALKGKIRELEASFFSPAGDESGRAGPESQSSSPYDQTEETSTADESWHEHNKEPWTADELMTKLAGILKDAPNLVQWLLKGLPVGPPEEEREDRIENPPHREAARRIIELGTGLKSAHKLSGLCFDAVFVDEDETRAEPTAIRSLLCTWLPFGYPEIDSVVLLKTKNRRTREAKHVSNLEARTSRRRVVEVIMARIDGRRCSFTVTPVQDSRKFERISDSMLPSPPPSSERIDAKGVADLVVEIVSERFKIEGVKQRVDAKSRIRAQKRRRRSPYFVVPADARETSFTDAAIESLNVSFPELRVIVLSDVPAHQEEAESETWTYIIDLMAE